MLQDVSDMFAAPRRQRPTATRVEARGESPEAAKRRERRQDDFEMFRRHAGEFLAAPPSDDAHERMIARSGFYFALGGPGLAPVEGRAKSDRPRGLDPRVIEAFYGSRAVPGADQIGNERLQKAWDQTSEVGAALLYVQGEDGAVSVFLYPAAIDGAKPVEDAILLTKITETEHLTGRGLIEAHWELFRAYAEATSFDGEPTIWDRVRVAWLRAVKPTIVDGRLRPSAALGALGRAGVFFAAILAAAAML